MKNPRIIFGGKTKGVMIRGQIQNTIPSRAGQSANRYWEGLHEWLRDRIQELIQELLEDEVTELLGRVRYQRRAVVDGPPGYRNGYGKGEGTPVSASTVARLQEGTAA